jgi:hypothetical protein
MKPEEEEKRFEDFLRSNREAFHLEQPDDAMLERIQQRMQTELASKASAKRAFLPAHFIRLAAACLLVAIAGTTLWFLLRKPVEDPNAALLAGMVDNNSAATRITNISSIAALEKPDTSIIRALFTVLNQDPNTNVRLAALESLSNFYETGDIKTKLIAELKSQQDPFVRISLIQLFTDRKERSILDELDNINVDLSTINEVRSQAFNSIFILRS